MERTKARRTATWRTAAVTSMLTVAVACQPADRPGAAGVGVDTTAVLAGVDSLRSAYAQAVADEDWERLGTLVTEDALIVQAGSPAWDSMLAASETPFPPGSTLEIQPRETHVLTGDRVVEIGRGVVTWTPEGADGARTLDGTYMVLLVRTDEGWKLHREVESDRALPEEGE